ncbi:caspase family protein [Pseudaminobacter sp. 19-2017]|uniref:Caspase family protein n=1 Tax=Pseudaminobacter soli (ex Zhang et al. 2022) TaxID=2831468 RepID=A0A942E827_9HYPH|nr:caspase family protein [Pseudaminobacter soli]MBS3650142.1 caspase family protein [Pseudaminobacter soli]
MEAVFALCRPSNALRRLALIILLSLPIFALAAVGALAAQDHVQGRRAALVIGNSAYVNLPKLPNSVNDAKRIGEVLRNANFEVTIGSDLTKAGLEKTVREFLQTLNDGDVALFYYSGHAVQVADQNFIIPVDANLSSAYDLEVESYNVTSLLDYMRATSGLQILVLDACRDNPFRNEYYYLGDSKVDVGGKQGLASLTPKQGSLIVYSTAPDQVAYDGGGDLSPFAGALADNLLSPNKEVREMLTLVRNAVMQRTGGRQVPWDVSSLTSQFYFVSAQEVLMLGESVTEVRVSPDATRVRLDIQPPIASKGLQLTASFEKLPKAGMLLLDDKTIQPNQPIDAQRMGDIVYVSDPGQKSVELLPYKIESNTGQKANGAVAIVFDPAIPQQPDTSLQVASNDDGESVTKAVPINLTLNADVGTGFKPVPALELGAGGRPTGWFRLEQRDPSAQVAVGDELLMLGDLVKAEDLPKVKIRPAIHRSNEEAQVVLTPAVVVPESKPVVIKVEAQVNACDELAAQPLDIQAVTEGVLPNDIDVPKAEAACRKAVADFPEIPRFKFQYGRVLYAKGEYQTALKMLREALDGGHVRAGQIVARLYQLGAGVELAPEKAIPPLEAAARRGDPYAQHTLGKALLEGNGVRRDVRRGLELLQKAVESGHTYALNQLGGEYLSGARVPKDVERAYVIFEKSAERGDVWGAVNLGLMYRDGVFVKQDKQRAYQLFEEANRNLHPYAATLMAALDKQEGRKDEAGLLALYRESAARGDGWGAFYAAEIVSTQPSLAKDPDEAIRLYGLAVARKSGKASEGAKARLKAVPAERLARESQKALVRMGAQGIEVDGKLGPRVRAAAAEILGRKPPSGMLDLYADLVQQEWIASTPRLDML